MPDFKHSSAMHLAHLKGSDMAILVASLVASLVVIMRLWRSGNTVHGLLIKVFLTLFVLVPVLGPLLYVFLANWPGVHSYRAHEIRSPIA